VGGGLNNLEVAKVLIGHGADVRARSTAGFTPLLFAASHGNLDMTRMLLDVGAELNGAAADGNTALLIATMKGHTAYATFLLEQGADPNAGAGFTPLHWAAGSWESELTNSVDGNEWSALAGLKGQAKAEFVKLLLAHGANPNARAQRNPPHFGGGGGPNLVGATPFLVAASAADVPVMRLLLAGGADPRLPTRDGTTPLIAAAGLGRAAAVTLVTAASALDAVKLALERGDDINAANAQGETALHAAAYWGADQVVQFLVETGANINAKNDKVWTPLTIAEGVFQGGGIQRFPTTADLLRKLGAEPSHPDVDRDTGGILAPDQPGSRAREVLGK
jgi:uncharacterized protein